MCKLISVISLLFVCVLPTCAAEINVFDYPIKDTMTVQAQICAPQHLVGTFTQQKNIADLGLTLKSSGRFAVNHNTGILWHMQKPVENKVVIKNGVLYIQNSGGSQTYNVAESQMLQHIIGIMQNILLQNYAELSAYFDLYFYKDPNSAEFYIGLKPTDSVFAEVFSHMTIEGSRYIDKVSFTDSSNDTTSIIFGDQTEIALDFDCETP